MVGEPHLGDKCALWGMQLVTPAQAGGIILSMLKIKKKTKK